MILSERLKALALDMAEIAGYMASDYPQRSKELSGAAVLALEWSEGVKEDGN